MRAIISNPKDRTITAIDIDGSLKSLQQIVGGMIEPVTQGLDEFHRSGIAASSFRLAYFCRRTPIFEALDRPGFHCRLRAATLAAATITPPPNAEA
jgi:hypothetical protein